MTLNYMYGLHVIIQCHNVENELMELYVMIATWLLVNGLILTLIPNIQRESVKDVMNLFQDVKSVYQPKNVINVQILIY